MYSAALCSHYEEPFHQGRPDRFDRSARKSNPVCGDELQFFLQVDRTAPASRVSSLCFEASGCLPCVSLASMLCQWAQGKSLTALRDLSEAELLSWCQGLPPRKQHAVALNIWALRELVSAELCDESSPTALDSAPRAVDHTGRTGEGDC